MRPIIAAISALLALAPLGAAQAANQAAVANCQTAIAGQLPGADAYRTKVERVRGTSRAQIFYLRLIPISGGEALDAVCKTSRDEVVSLQISRA